MRKLFKMNSFFIAVLLFISLNKALAQEAVALYGVREVGKDELGIVLFKLFAIIVVPIIIIITLAIIFVKKSRQRNEKKNV